MGAGGSKRSPQSGCKQATHLYEVREILYNWIVVMVAQLYKLTKYH